MFYMSLKYLLCGMAFVACATIAEAFNNVPESISASISLKVPGNGAKHYPLTFQKSQNNNGTYYLENSEKMPLTVSQNIVTGNDGLRISVSITALEDVYFNYNQQMATGFRHDDCLFYMPGFWYRRNLRSPKEAPSFHTSDSWIVSEDRLSAPLTGIFCEKTQRFMTVNRLDKFVNSTLATHREGEIILSDKTSLGYTGFENKGGVATLSFGFPYREAPKSYIRKLTLAPAVTAYQLLKKGETILLTWQIVEGEVIRLLAFGAIIKLENGATGMLHISKATTQERKSIHEIVHVGDKLQVEIIEKDEEKNRLSFAIPNLKAGQ